VRVISKASTTPRAADALHLRRGGNLLTITDPNGHVTEFAYDALGRKKSRKLPEG